MLLTVTDLKAIISDLNLGSTKLSDEKLSEMCEKLNVSYYGDVAFRTMAANGAPQKLEDQWKKIEREAKKLQELLRPVQRDLQLQLDKVHGKPRTNAPSEAAEIAASIITDGLSLLMKVAQSGIDTHSGRKDSRRQYDLLRDFIIFSISRTYQEFFQTKVSARREGQWPTFLSRVLSILNDKEKSPDAAYDRWRRVNKLLHLDKFIGV